MTSVPSPPMAQWVVFGLDARRIAVPLTAVERVVRAVQITPLPQAPSMVMGVINVRGAVLPVMNVDIGRRQDCRRSNRAHGTRTPAPGE